MSYGFKASLNFLLATKYFSFRMALIAPLNRTYIGMHYAGVYIVHFYQPLAPTFKKNSRVHRCYKVFYPVLMQCSL